MVIWKVFLKNVLKQRYNFVIGRRQGTVSDSVMVEEKNGVKKREQKWGAKWGIIKDELNEKFSFKWNSHLFPSHC